MPETIISQFQRAFNSPIEIYRQVATPTERDNIPSGVRWPGMLVYVVSDGVTYSLSGGGVDNGSWELLGGLQDAPSDGQTYGRKDGNWELIPDGGVDWGDIGGVLSTQTDLQSALDSKLSDAPSDGDIYGRKDGDWEIIDINSTIIDSFYDTKTASTTETLKDYNTFDVPQNTFSLGDKIIFDGYGSFSSMGVDTVRLGINNVLGSANYIQKNSITNGYFRYKCEYIISSNTTAIAFLSVEITDSSSFESEFYSDFISNLSIRNNTVGLSQIKMVFGNHHSGGTVTYNGATMTILKK